MPLPPVPQISPEDLIGNPDAFPVLRRWRYFNHGGVCPIPTVAAEAFKRYADQASTGANLDTDWYPRLDRCRARLAGLISADPAEIALLKNTSEGLATVAAMLTLAPGDRIVTTGAEYPSNFYPWQQLARRSGAELVVVPERVADDGTVSIPEAELLAAIAHPRTRLVAVSHVQFASGQGIDAAAVGRACREVGALFCLDCIQTAGVLPVDVRAMHVDFAAADGHKWLLGPEGAGFLYVRRELVERYEPPLVGWNSVTNALAFDSTRYELKPDAGRFECGSLTVPAFLSLLASTELLLSVGIEAIAARVHALTDRLADGLTRKGYTLRSPRHAHAWSGLVAFDKPDTDLRALQHTLRRTHHCELALRAGRLRASPHFYNTEAEIDALLTALP